MIMSIYDRDKFFLTQGPGKVYKGVLHRTEGQETKVSKEEIYQKEGKSFTLNLKALS
jgi:hypothetical protein